MDNQKQLPDICFTCIETNPPGKFIGAIRRGESGYYATTYDVQDLQRARELVDYLNTQKLCLSPAQVLAMECGSHFGWDAPGAQVETCEKMLRKGAERLASANT